MTGLATLTTWPSALCTITNSHPRSPICSSITGSARHSWFDHDQTHTAKVLRLVITRRLVLIEPMQAAATTSASSDVADVVAKGS